MTRVIGKDLVAGLVVFLVALPLCLGIALASNAPLIAGLVSGVIGGIIVGMISGSSTSVSGPAAGLTVVVASQIASLGSFEAFLVAVIIAGVIQITLGVLRWGAIAAFCPSSVIEGLLAAIGLILIFKQLPHLLGHDADPEGDMAFQQPDHENTFSEIIEIARDLHPGAALIGITCLILLILWDRYKLTTRIGIPGPLAAVFVGGLGSYLLKFTNDHWSIGQSHLVQVPVAKSPEEFFSFLYRPDFSQFASQEVLIAGFTIAVVASLESLLNLEAVDKLDPQQRSSPPNRELVAQGVGNIAAGCLCGIPVTAVIVRGTVNIQAGAQSKLSAISHGFFLLFSVLFPPGLLNIIPLSCLAAILLQTGFKLANWRLFKHMWSMGQNQFLPFIATVLLIVFTDLLIGVALGLVIALGFILRGNLRRPIHKIRERHLAGDVLRIELADHVSFLNKAALADALDKSLGNEHVLLDARRTEYIDPDILELIHEFETKRAPAHGTRVSLLGFKDDYKFQDRIEFIDYTTSELQRKLKPSDIIELLQRGNERFRTGSRLTRDFARLREATARGQFPLAVVLSCMDSRTSIEMVFDLALGDIFSVRMAGNVAKEKALGSMEYGCAVAGARLALVLGHTQCGAVGAAVDLQISGKTAYEATGCDHLDVLTREIQKSIRPEPGVNPAQLTGDAKMDFVNFVARQNVMRTLQYIRTESKILSKLESEGEIAIIGGMYDIRTSEVDFFGSMAPLQRVDGKQILTV